MPPDLLRRRDLGAILDESFALYRRHARTLLLATLLVVLPVDLAVLGGGLGWLWSGYQRDAQTASILVGALAQILVLSPLVAAIVVHVLREAAVGPAPGPRSALQHGFGQWGALVGTMLLVVALVVAGLFALIVPGIVIGVHLAVVAQVVIVEDVRGAEALRRGWALVRGSAWWTFGVLLVANLIAGVLSLVVTLPLSVLAEQADAQAVTLVAEIVAHVFTLPLLAIATTLVYATLLVRERERGTPVLPGAPARPVPPTPAPDAPRYGAEGWLAPTPPPSDPGHTS
jgi:hypothetical protein